jgi:hypothetical protein
LIFYYEFYTFNRKCFLKMIHSALPSGLEALRAGSGGVGLRLEELYEPEADK